MEAGLTVGAVRGQRGKPALDANLRKARSSATAPFDPSNGEGDLSRAHSETDTSAWLRFFDLRVANACEEESLDDEPPGR